MTEYKLQKCVSYLHHVYLSICLFTCNNTRAAERIFMKFLWGIYTKICLHISYLVIFIL
jgi:hypothetical protein